MRIDSGRPHAAWEERETANVGAARASSDEKKGPARPEGHGIIDDVPSRDVVTSVFGPTRTGRIPANLAADVLGLEAAVVSFRKQLARPEMAKVMDACAKTADYAARSVASAALLAGSLAAFPAACASGPPVVLAVAGIVMGATTLDLSVRGLNESLEKRSAAWHALPPNVREEVRASFDALRAATEKVIGDYEQLTGKRVLLPWRA